MYIYFLVVINLGGFLSRVLPLIVRKEMKESEGRKCRTERWI